MNETTAEEIAARVQQALRETSDPAGRRVRVHADHLRRVGGPFAYWYVPVLIDPDEREMYRIYQILSDVEEALSAQGVERVFLVPGVLEFNQKSGSKNHG